MSTLAIFGSIANALAIIGIVVAAVGVHGLARRKFNQATCQRIIGSIGAGATLASASRAAGINPRTLTRWLREGDYDLSCGRETDKAAFTEAFREAEANVLHTLESNVFRHSHDDWRAGRFILSKRAPTVYGNEGTEVLARQIIDAILERIRERCTPEQYDVFVAALDDPIEVESK